MAQEQDEQKPIERIYECGSLANRICRKLDEIVEHFEQNSEEQQEYALTQLCMVLKLFS